MSVNVWAVEVWSDAHWTTVAGGLDRAEAERQANALIDGRAIVSIAEYSLNEGSSVIRRCEVGGDETSEVES